MWNWLLVLLILAHASMGSTSASAASDSSSSSPSPARTESLIADLRTYIPERLASWEVPGVAVALVQEGEIAWEAGFGVANTLTGTPVAEDSVFEVGSLSKPVAAYAALRLVDAGALHLDEPLYQYFDEPWLPRSEWSDQITLRRVLSHTSGLSKQLHPLDKSLDFPPGERFAYSNVGYQYLQAAMERVSGSSLEEVAHEEVFEPLGMTSSTFADRPDVNERLVAGHINYGSDLGAVVALLALCFAVILLLGVGARRILGRRSAITWRHIAVVYVAAVVASFPVLVWLNGGLNKWSVFFGLLLGAMSIWLWLWLFATTKIYRRLSRETTSPRRRIAVGIASFLSCIVAFAIWANAVSGPVPKGPASTPGAAYSLKSTAGDLARFMIELGGPEHVDSRAASQMSTPQCRTSPTNSWGLGIAIYHAPDGDWLWHAGDNQDFHALMVMQPATGRGIVALANGQSGSPAVFDVARRAMGVDFTWSSR